MNGLSVIQRDELTNYFKGFMQLLDNQKVDSGELLRISLSENYKIVISLWVLGVTFIGIPFIFLAIGIKGFLVGFSSGFIIEAIGLKGVMFTVLVLFPKELIMVPCIIALGVNGINFSMNMMKRKSLKFEVKESLKARFIAYCFVTIFYSCFLFFGCLVEAYVTPIIVRLIAPFVSV